MFEEDFPAAPDQRPEFGFAPRSSLLGRFFRKSDKTVSEEISACDFFELHKDFIFLGEFLETVTFFFKYPDDEESFLF